MLSRICRETEEISRYRFQHKHPRCNASGVFVYRYQLSTGVQCSAPCAGVEGGGGFGAFGSHAQFEEDAFVGAGGVEGLALARPRFCSLLGRLRGRFWNVGAGLSRAPRRLEVGMPRFRCVGQFAPKSRQMEHNRGFKLLNSLEELTNSRPPKATRIWN